MHVDVMEDGIADTDLFNLKAIKVKLSRAEYEICHDKLKIIVTGDLLSDVVKYDFISTVAVVHQGKKDLARVDVDVEDAYDSVDEMLNAGPQIAEDKDVNDSDFDPEVDRQKYAPVI